MYVQFYLSQNVYLSTSIYYFVPKINSSILYEKFRTYQSLFASVNRSLTDMVIFNCNLLYIYNVSWTLICILVYRKYFEAIKNGFIL